MLRDVEFESVGIHFPGYPFAPASVHKTSLLSLTDIREFLPNGHFPPEVRTRGGEVLFVPASQREDMASYAKTYGVPCVNRTDVWSLLLEPFLDTSFDKDDELRTARQLQGAGIEQRRIDDIRKRVGPAMMAYNFDSMLWEWVHLGLFDVLQAVSGHLSGRAHSLSHEQFDLFYWDAMRLAEKGSLISKFSK